MKNIKKKLALLAISSITIFNLVGCTQFEKTRDNAEINTKTYSDTINNIVAVDIPSTQTDGIDLSIITDKRTGVQYLRSYQGGIQVIVDKDGKPLTVDVKGDK